MTSEAQKKAKERYYQKSIRRIPFEVQQYEYEALKASADKEGKPLNTFIKECLWDKIGKPQKPEG